MKPFLKKLIITNFCSYLGEHIVDPFPVGLTYLRADNKDIGFSTNGGGKTTFANAVAVCLYGETSLGVSKDDLIATGADNYCLEIYAEGLWVKRFKDRGKSEVLTFWTPNTGRNVEKNLAQTQYDLEKELGIPKKIFFAAFFVNAESSTTQLLTARSSERLKILQEVFNEDRYKQLYAMATAERKSQEKVQANLTRSMDKMRDTIGELSSVYSDLLLRIEREKINKTDQLKSKHKQLQEEVATLTEGLKKAATQEVIETDACAKYGGETQLFQVIATLKAEYKAASSQTDPLNIGDICPSCKQPVTTDAAKHLTEMYIANNKRAKKLQEEIANSNTQLLDVQTHKKRLQEVVRVGNTFVAKLAEKRRQVESLVQAQADSAAPITPMLEQKEELKKRIQELKDKLLADSLQTIPCTKSIEAYTFWEKAYSPSGIPNLLLDKVRAYLGKFCNEYLNKMAGHKFRLEFPPGEGVFEIKVLSDNGVTNIKALSGGQRARITLAWTLGLRKSVMALFPSKLNILMWDDILSCVDEEGEVILQDTARLLTEEVAHMLLSLPRLPDRLEGNVIDILYENNKSKIAEVKYT